MGYQHQQRGEGDIHLWYARLAWKLSASQDRQNYWRNEVGQRTRIIIHSIEVSAKNLQRKSRKIIKIVFESST